MQLEKMFPQTIFSEQYVQEHGLDKAIVKQLGVVAGELFETGNAAAVENYEKVLEESVDAIQAVFTLMYMVPGYSEQKITALIERVREKNKERGYLV